MLHAGLIGKRNALMGNLTTKQLQRQQGVFAILLAVLLPLILAILGMGLGLAQMYNRRVELQSIANATALAAAQQLNGTKEGLEAALARAKTTAEGFKHSYKAQIIWNEDAISFSDSPDPGGSWNSADPTSAGTQFFAKVDTSKLGADAGLVAPIFMQLLSKFTSVRIDALAIAGRTRSRITPLAVCAFSSLPGVARGTELVQYGFRRGVVYDLMKLNPDGDTGEHFVVDPTAVPGANSSKYNTSAAFVSPFVCTGKMWIPTVTGGKLSLTRGFPIADLYKQLNSRFDEYEDKLCSPNGAPPDLNIKAFTGSWMSPAQTKPYTAAYVTSERSWTVADPQSVPTGTTLSQWGALWSYAKAVKFSTYKANSPEPAEGYPTFLPSDMGTLYQTGLKASSYPLFETPPYMADITYPRDVDSAVEHRRVLHIPLLSCPLPAGQNLTGSALAVGKFFMVQPATADSVIAEFAGIAPQELVTGPAELFQ